MVTDAALIDAVGPEVLDRARPYTARTRLGLQLTADARRVTALVQGTAPMPYRTTVVRAEGSRIGWVGACTCPVGEECKHAVAGLLSLRGGAPGATGNGRPGQARSWEQELEELVGAAAPAPHAAVPVG